jgi:hypothetical protein
MSEEHFDACTSTELTQQTVQVDMGSLSSVTLARLVDEVRNDEPNTARSYDRTHNRHNR